MKHILQHPARLVTILLAAATIGFLLLMHLHSDNATACTPEATGMGIIKLI